MALCKGPVRILWEIKGFREDLGFGVPLDVFFNGSIKVCCKGSSKGRFQSFDGSCKGIQKGSFVEGFKV